MLRSLAEFDTALVMSAQSRTALFDLVFSHFRLVPASVPNDTMVPPGSVRLSILVVSSGVYLSLLGPGCRKVDFHCKRTMVEMLMARVCQ